MTPETVAHLHLLTNHVPTIGLVVACGLLLLALARKNDDLMRAGLEVLCIVALATFLVYVTGMAGQFALKGREGVSEAAIRAHQDAALLSFVFMQITGAIAWLALWQCRRLGRARNGVLTAVVLLSVVTLILMAGAGNIGGEIRHPEIGSTASFPLWVNTPSLQQFIVGEGQQWVWVTSETLHFAGLSLLFGVLGIVNLRLLGLMRSMSFAAVHRLLPWAILGLGINFLTGMVFFIGNPDQYTTNVMFHWKVLFLLLGGASLLWTTVSGRAWGTQAGEAPPPVARAVAAASLFLWLAVLYCGRMLPFIGDAF